MSKKAFTDSFLRAIYFSLALHVVITVIFISVIYDIFNKGEGYFDKIPLYIVASILLFSALCLWFDRSLKIPVIRSFGLLGGLSVTPLLLFFFSIPATIYFITGGTQITVADWSLLGIVTVSFVVYAASLVVFTIPCDLILSVGFDSSQRRTLTLWIVILFIILVASVAAIVLNIINLEFAFPLSFSYLLLPLGSVIVFFISVISLRRLKHDIKSKIASFEPEKRTQVIDKRATGIREKSSIFNVLYFREKYLYLISGDTTCLTHNRNDVFAASVINFANRNYDLALLPSLETIASAEKYGESVQHEAAGVIYNIEKYYSNPGKNVDMIVQEGVHEKVASARKTLVSPRKPQTSEVLRLLKDPDPELRRIALAVIGRFKIAELLPDVILALSNPETEKDAYFLLSYFGPLVVRELSKSFESTVDNVNLSLLKIRLLTTICSPYEINNLASTFWQGAVRMKSKGMKYLKDANFVPSEKDKDVFTEYLSEILCNITRIISLEYAAERRKCFGLSLALRQERLVNISFAFDLLVFITDEKTAAYLKKQIESRSWITRKYASEVINVVIDEPLRGPILALTDQSHPQRMLQNLRYYYSFREPDDANLVTLILNSDQNIAGTWVKACALRCVSEGKLTASADLLISYLYSSSQILQEEATRALRKTKPEAFASVAYRLPKQTASIIKEIFADKIEDVALIYEKVRFLALCFGSIPEERLIPLGRKMQYSGSGDSRHMAGVVPWIIPGKDGRSGLYSLTQSEISDFVFHNPEYMDILILCIDKAMTGNVN